MLKTWSLLLLLVLPAAGTVAQETWSLERCVLHAQDNNLLMKQAQTTVRTAQLSKQAAQAARLPSINGQVNAGEQYGRTIDPTTNQFVTTGIGFNSMSLNAGMTVFSGGQILHSIKQSKYELGAAQADAEQTANNLGLQVAQAYLNVLLAEEQLESARRRVEQSKLQQQNTQKLIDAGSLPAADRFNLLAQVARDEQSAITAENSVELAYLALKQLLQLEPNFDLRIERPEIRIPTPQEEYSLMPVYNTALTTQPAVRAAAFRLKSADEGISIAKAAYWPTMTVFANLSSNYSTQFLDFENPRFIERRLSPAQTVVINGQEISIQTYFDVNEYPRLDYWKQLDRNFGQGIGVSLNIPIYNNGRTQLSVERARLNRVTQELQDNQTRQQLKNDIQTAIANVRAARKQLDAAQRTLEATQTAFTNTEKRHQLGAVNTLEFTNARLNLDIAENSLIVARYDYLFKLKILDFYLGKPLKLDE